MEPSEPGVNATPPVEPAASANAPAAPAPSEPAAPVTPSASEGVNPPASPEEQHVPYQRFQEVNDAKKAAEERLAELEQQLEASRTQTSTPENEDDLDPEVEELVRKAATKLGLVSKFELEVAQDVKSLESEYANSGVPYNHQEILKYAKDNSLPITSKAALRAAYRDMNWDKIVEAERQRSIDAYKSAGSGSAERPGNSAPPEPSPAQAGSLKSRIGAARQKLQA